MVRNFSSQLNTNYTLLKLQSPSYTYIYFINIIYPTNIFHCLTMPPLLFWICVRDIPALHSIPNLSVRKVPTWKTRSLVILHLENSWINENFTGESAAAIKCHLVFCQHFECRTTIIRWFVNQSLLWLKLTQMPITGNGYNLYLLTRILNSNNSQ